MSLDLKRRFVSQLVETSRLLRNYIDHRAKSRGTTRAQWIVLFRLREQEGLSQVDLADVLELQPISLVRLLDRLVEHGLLERRHDPKDRRANRLFLTASGRQLVDDLDSLRDENAGDAGGGDRDQPSHAAGGQGPHQEVVRSARACCGQVDIKQGIWRAPSISSFPLPLRFTLLVPTFARGRRCRSLERLQERFKSHHQE
jgi:MarR family transcriptional regulator for hemolysin